MLGLGEKLTLNHAVGFALIALGAWFIFRGASGGVRLKKRVDRVGGVDIGRRGAGRRKKRVDRVGRVDMDGQAGRGSWSGAAGMDCQRPASFPQYAPDPTSGGQIGSGKRQVSDLARHSFGYRTGFSGIASRGDLPGARDWAICRA